MVTIKRAVGLLYFFIVASMVLFTVVILLIPGKSMIVDDVIDSHHRFHEMDDSLRSNVTVIKNDNKTLNSLDVRKNLSATSWGYLLVVDYEQQLMGGYMAFYHLANISSMLNLTSVEPYVRKTGLEGASFVDRGMDPQVVKLSTFYDINRLRSLIKSCMNNDLVTFETFLENASRDVVLVAFLYTLHYHEEYFIDGSKVVEIDSPTQSLMDGLHHLNQWSSYVLMLRNWRSAPFRHARVVLIDARPRVPLPLSHLIQRLSSVIQRQVREYGSATVIVDIFRDIQLTSRSYFFSDFPGFNWQNCTEMDTLQHSSQVLIASKEFALSLNQTCPVVGIHIRMERILTDHKVKVASYLDCFYQLKKLLVNGTIANVSQGSVFVFHDVGKYGTKRCIYKSDCLRGKHYVLSLLRRMRLKVVEFDPKSFHPPGVRSAFAALVEMEYLSNVDVLIILGFGEYQGHIIRRFLKNHRGKTNNFYHICQSQHSVILT